MALTFVTAIQQVTVDLSHGYLVDYTVYGGSNVARNTLSIFVYIAKRDVNNNDTFLTIDNSSPLTATQWYFSMPAQDGNFVASIFAFNIWSAGSYTLNACVYYSPNSSYYIANTGTSSTPGADGTWTLITNILQTCSGNSSVQQAQTYNFSAAVAQAGALSLALADFGNNVKLGRYKSWEDAAQVLIGPALIQSALTNFRQGNYTNCQSIMDYVDAQTQTTYSA